MTERLYHYTCDDGARGILRDGEIRPNKHPLLPVPVIWLTSLEHPDRMMLGLTSRSLRCDRTSWRVTLQTDEAEPWHVFARRYRITRGVREDLERGRWPMCWFVALDPLPIDKHAVQRTREEAR